jgi:hypothetical protein
MLKIILPLLFLLPLECYAENQLAGRYAGCAVSLESSTDAPASKFYVFTFGTDSSLDLTVETYAGTESCDNQPTGHYEYKDFVFLDDTGNGPGRFMTAREVHTNLFFKFVVAKSYAAIDSSATYPVKSGLIDAMALDRVP